MKILNRFTGELIFEYQNRSIKETVETAAEEKISLEGANLEGANLNGAHLEGVNLINANLSNANLMNANLMNANLMNADLRGSNLIGSYLRHTDLSFANMRATCLTEADLRGADLRGSNLTEANLWGEKLCKNPLYINAGLRYQVWATDRKIKIGCQLHSTAAWEHFTDAQIKEMDGDDALKFWAVWKKPILAMAKQHQRKEEK